MKKRRPAVRTQQAQFVSAVIGQRDAARKQLALVTELAQNYADGLLSAGTAMDAVAAALLAQNTETPA